MQIAGGETTLLLLHGAIATGAITSTIILASLRFIIPKTIVDYFGNRSTQAEILGATEHVEAD